MVKYCPNCGCPNPDEAEYCLNCGTPLPVTQQPPGRGKFPVKAVIGTVVSVVVIIVLLFVLLPMWIDSSVSSPSCPISASALAILYGGSWVVVSGKSETFTFTPSGVSVTYFNGTSTTMSYSEFSCLMSLYLNYSPVNFYLNYSQMSKLIFITISYKLCYGSAVYLGDLCEVVIIPKAGTTLYNELTSITVSDLASVGVSHVSQSGNIVYGYSSVKMFEGKITEEVEIIVNKANGEMVILMGLPGINSLVASQLANYV